MCRFLSAEPAIKARLVIIAEVEPKLNLVCQPRAFSITLFNIQELYHGSKGF